MAGTVRLEGLRELNAALGKIDRDLRTQLGDDLREAAEPVAASARDKVTQYQGASVSTIRARRSGLRVWVEQGARKVTGRRGDYGALQLRTVLMPALDENSDGVLTTVGHVLDRYGRSAGF